MDERYQILNRILENNRNNKDNVSNSILVVSSGALVLSFSFIQYFGYTSDTAFFLKTAWLLLFLTIISNILSRHFFTEIIRIQINKEDYKIREPENAKKLLESYKPEGKVSIFYSLFQCLHWGSFILGLAILLLFAWFNV